MWSGAMTIFLDRHTRLKSKLEKSRGVAQSSIKSKAFNSKSHRYMTVILRVRYAIIQIWAKFWYNKLTDFLMIWTPKRLLICHLVVPIQAFFMRLWYALVRSIPYDELPNKMGQIGKHCWHTSDFMVRSSKSLYFHNILLHPINIWKHLYETHANTFSKYFSVWEFVIWTVGILKKKIS